MSLSTLVYAQARMLAAELNVVFERLRDQLPMIASDQVNQVFDKMQACLAVEIASPSFDTNESVRIGIGFIDFWRRAEFVNVDAEMEGTMKPAGLAGIVTRASYGLRLGLEQFRLSSAFFSN